MVEYSVRKIGANSKNGFVVALSKDGQTQVLKCPKNSKKDNLIYEYLAGESINNFYDYYPFFVKTNGLYRIPRDLFRTLRSIPKNNEITIRDFPDRKIRHNSLDKWIDEACTNPGDVAVSLEYVNISYTLYEFYEKYKKEPKMLCQLIGIMYLVYYTLSNLRNVFTHKDLHGDNVVLIYEPQKYVINTEDGKKIEFSLDYRPLMLDFGRAYVNFGMMNSVEFAEKVCDSKKCGGDINYGFKNCGKNFGFNFTRNEETKRLTRIQGIHVLNNTQDLFLISGIRNELKSMNVPNKIKQMLSESLKFVFEKGTLMDTIDKLPDGAPNTLNTIRDVRKMFEKIIVMPEFLNELPKYANGIELWDNMRHNYSKFCNSLNVTSIDGEPSKQWHTIVEESSVKKDTKPKATKKTKTSKQKKLVIVKPKSPKKMLSPKQKTKKTKAPKTQKTKKVKLVIISQKKTSPVTKMSENEIELPANAKRCPKGYQRHKTKKNICVKKL